MSDLSSLYQELIVDHGRHPRNFGKLARANHMKEGYNPLCGDRLIIYLYQENNIVREVAFEGEGCAISMASASLMTEALKGKTLHEVDILFDAFHDVVTGVSTEEAAGKIGKLIALAGVAQYPMRVKCATLCWHTLLAAMNNSKELVSTE